jgi:hypothetical protein
VLHHARPLAGAALVAGVTGKVSLPTLGLVVSIPSLRRLYRRFGTWKAPAIALVLFAVTFASRPSSLVPRFQALTLLRSQAFYDPLGMPATTHD